MAAARNELDLAIGSLEDAGERFATAPLLWLCRSRRPRRPLLALFVLLLKLLIAPCRTPLVICRLTTGAMATPVTSVQAACHLMADRVCRMRRGEFGCCYSPRICPSGRLNKATIFCWTCG